MSIVTRAVEHALDRQSFESLLVLDDAQPGPRPTILVFHAWEGRSEDQEKFAKRLTAWGYSAIAVDLFGKGRRGTTREECQALIAPFMKDRVLLRKRLLHVMETAQEKAEIDVENVGAIGFCFGGLCALDAARAGAQLKGVASFHGLLIAPGLPTAKPVAAKVIAFHGWDDPMVPPDQVLAFGQELTACGADWQLHAYGGAMHAFMNEGANNPERGLVYNPQTARRAWNELRLFFADVFGGAIE